MDGLPQLFNDQPRKISRPAQSAPRLESIAQGALQEQFDSEFLAVMRNIADPDTVIDKPREITIKMVFKTCGEDRSAVTMNLSVSSKIAPQEPILSTIFIEGMDTDRPQGVEAEWS